MVLASGVRTLELERALPIEKAPVRFPLAAALPITGDLFSTERDVTERTAPGLDEVPRDNALRVTGVFRVI